MDLGGKLKEDGRKTCTRAMLRIKKNLSITSLNLSTSNLLLIIIRTIGRAVQERSDSR